MTPVALTAERRRYACAAAISSETSAASSPGSRPARISSRARSSTARAASTASAVRRRRETRVAQQLVDRRELAQLHAESVGTSSRNSETSESAARAPISSTCSWSIGSGETPAARFVTHEIGEAADAHVPRGEHLGHGGHADEVGAERAQHADLGRRLERWAEPGGVHALAEIEAEPVRCFPSRGAQLRVVRVRHVGKARPEALVVRADERRLRPGG